MGIHDYIVVVYWEAKFYFCGIGFLLTILITCLPFSSATIVFGGFFGFFNQAAIHKLNRFIVNSSKDGIATKELGMFLLRSIPVTALISGVARNLRQGVRKVAHFYSGRRFFFHTSLNNTEIW